MLINDTERAKELRKKNSNYTYCYGCGLPWSHCNSKVVKTSEWSGTFATCEDCWNTLSLEELKECFKGVYYFRIEAWAKVNVKALPEDIQESVYTSIEDDDLEHMLSCVEEEFKRTRE